MEVDDIKTLSDFYINLPRLQLASKVVEILPNSRHSSCQFYLMVHLYFFLRHQHFQ